MLFYFVCVLIFPITLNLQTVMKDNQRSYTTTHILQYIFLFCKLFRKYGMYTIKEKCIWYAFQKIWLI